MKPGKKPAPFHSRLDKVSKPGCHLWTGKLDVYGYGKVWIDGREVIASRHAWLLHHGRLPADLCVLHRCDTPACVKPDHLFLGTRLDNMRDKFEKGRAKGPPKFNLNAADLTIDDVLNIRKDIRIGCVIADDYGVSKTAINDIKARRTWRNIA